MTFARETVRRLARAEDQLDRLKTMEASPTLGELFGMYLGLPGLVGFWPANNYDAGGNIYDLSGQARTLTKSGTVVPTVLDPPGMILYQDFQGGFFTRASETNLQIAGNLTIGCWCWIDALDTTTRGLIGKSNSTGNQRGYTLFKTNSDVLRFQVSSDGTATTLIDSAAPAAGAWLFAVGRYFASTSLDLFIGQSGVFTQYTNTTSIPASIFNSTAPFEIGAVNNGAAVWDGRALLCFLTRVRLRDAHIRYLYNRSAVFFQ